MRTMSSLPPSTILTSTVLLLQFLWSLDIFSIFYFPFLWADTHTAKMLTHLNFGLYFSDIHTYLFVYFFLL